MLALLTSAVVLTGILAPADPLVLERVEVRRVRNDWGLTEFAGVGVVRIAVDDCSLLGHQGLIISQGGTWSAYVVDCTCEHDATLESMGLIADVSVPELGHKKATVILW